MHMPALGLVYIFRAATVKLLDSDTDSTLDNLYSQLHEAEVSLNHVISGEIQGIITRSRIQWAEEG